MEEPGVEAESQSSADATWGQQQEYPALKPQFGSSASTPGSVSQAFSSSYQSFVSNDGNGHDDDSSVERRRM